MRLQNLFLLLLVAVFLKSHAIDETGSADSLDTTALTRSCTKTVNCLKVLKNVCIGGDLLVKR